MCGINIQAQVCVFSSHSTSRPSLTVGSTRTNKASHFCRLTWALGASEERANACRAAGSMALLDRGLAAGQAYVCTTRLCGAVAVVGGMSVCSTPPGFQAGVVQAVRPPSPLSALLRFRAGPLAFFGPVGVGKYRSFPWPNPALKGTRC